MNNKPSNPQQPSATLSNPQQPIHSLRLAPVSYGCSSPKLARKPYCFQSVNYLWHDSVNISWQTTSHHIKPWCPAILAIHLFWKFNSHTLCHWKVAGSAPPADPAEEKKPEAELLQCVLGGNTKYVRGLFLFDWDILWPMSWGYVYIGIYGVCHRCGIQPTKSMRFDLVEHSDFTKGQTAICAGNP